MEKIDTLFLSGGGINSISYIGVFKYLLKMNIIEKNFKNIKNIVCVSGSSIIVFPLLLGFSLEATIKLYMDTNYDNWLIILHLILIIYLNQFWYF